MKYPRSPLFMLLSIFAVSILVWTHDASAGAHPRVGMDGVLCTPQTLFEELNGHTVDMSAMRVVLDWNAIQSCATGAFDWSAYDALVEKAAAHNVEVVFVFGPCAEWASCAEPQEPREDKICKMPKNWSHWQKYVSAAVSHFKGRVKYWQIWEGFDFQHFRGTRQQMEKLVDVTSKAVRAVDPQVRLILPETGGLDLGWIASLKGTPVWPAFDIVGLRPFAQEPASLTLPLAVLQAEVLNGSGKQAWIIGRAQSLCLDVPVSEIPDPAAFLNAAFAGGIERVFTTPCVQLSSTTNIPNIQPILTRLDALAQSVPFSHLDRVVFDINAEQSESGLSNASFRTWPGGRLVKTAVNGARALQTTRPSGPLTLENRKTDNPWFYFDIDNRFLYFTGGRVPVTITVEVRGASAADAAGFNIYYDAGFSHRFTPWQKIDAGPDRWFTYRMLIPDAWFADKCGYDFRINTKGSKEDVYISRVEVERR